AFLEAAERFGDVASDRRLLGNYKRLGHGGWNRTQLRRFCKWQQQSRDPGQSCGPWQDLSYPSLTKYFPGNCFTKRFSSNCNKVDETTALGSAAFAAMSSIGVSDV